MQESLREIKNRRTHRALAEAAFELAMEHGLDGFVIDDVASRAGYSRRTFANYFSGKEEAVAAAVITEGIAGAVAELGPQSSGGSLLDLLERITRAQLDERTIERIVRLQELAQRYPTLRPYLLLTGEGLRESAAAVIRSHNPSDASLDTVLALHAWYGTLSALFTGGLEIVPEGEPRVAGALTVAEFLDLAFSRLRSGFDSGPAPTS